MSVTVVTDAIADYGRYVERLPEKARTAARMAINDTIRGPAMRALRAHMQQEVAFPAGYLTDPRRLSVKRVATDSNLEAAITAQHRPTSLARFSIGGAVGQRGGVDVRVGTKSGTSEMKRAFLIRLNQGTELSDTAFNLGLAIRLKPGEKIQNKRVQIWKDLDLKGDKGAAGQLYLLYGPSVWQVMREAAFEVAPEMADVTSAEFLRQFIRLTGG